ncbi:MAG: hypothetical protein A4S09_07255 [Proteobacteria bacterium SG_bin7]|nr:MAG: hypothetical protein A4S09_07255 [Proteobacteria bacterium SG_bin7]
MKKFGSTYIFAILVLAIGVYTYFFEFKKAEEEKLKETEGIKLLRDFSQEQITSIRWQKGTTDVEMQKKDGLWRLLQPLDAEADKYTMESVLTTLTTEKEDILKLDDPKGVDPKSFGFAAGSGFIEIKTSGATKRFIISDKKTFDGRQYHMKVDGNNEIYLVSTAFGELLEKPVKELRSKEILGEILPKQFTVQVDGKPEATFEKFGEEWKNVPNKDLKLDPKAVGDWIAALKYVKAHDFLTENATDADKKKYGLDKPNLKVKILEPKKSIEFIASNPKDQKIYLLTNQKPIIYEVTTAMMTPIQKTISDFRDKKIPFTFDESNVTQVQIDKPGLKVTLDKAKDHWKVSAGGDKKDADTATLNSLVTKLRDISVDKFLLPQDVVKGLTPPSQKLILKDQTGKTILELALGEKFVEGPDQFIYAKTNLIKENFVVKASKIDELNVDRVLKSDGKAP